MATSIGNVELGFLEKPKSTTKLKSHFFPSKVGGKPAWLDLRNLPSPNNLICMNCGEQCTFLLQLYAPNNAREDCFHRTIFIFICKNPSCLLSKANYYRVLRCQLPRVNNFYSSEPPDDDINEELEIARTSKSLCIVCGSAGPLTCASCKLASYCSKVHQSIHWRSGHKVECKSLGEFFAFPSYVN